MKDRDTVQDKANELYPYVMSETNESTVLALRSAFRAGAEWQQEQPAGKDTSDGHHTFEELYLYRMLYNAHAAQGWKAEGYDVVKSWYHSDGELCFGGGWFIVTVTIPGIGQISNHYRAEHWEVFKVQSVSRPPEYDGHTPEIAAQRLRLAL